MNLPLALPGGQAARLGLGVGPRAEGPWAQGRGLLSGPSHSFTLKAGFSVPVYGI